MAPGAPRRILLTCGLGVAALAVAATVTGPTMTGPTITGPTALAETPGPSHSSSSPSSSAPSDQVTDLVVTEDSAADVRAVQGVAGSRGRSRAASYSYDIASDALLPNGRVGTTVIRWDACKAIRWAVNPAGAPPGFLTIARQAATELSRATGLRMVYAGTTTIRPQAIDGRLVDGPLNAARLQLVLAWDTRSDPGSLLADTSRTSDAAGATVREVESARSRNGRVLVPTQYVAAAVALDLSQKGAMVRDNAHGDGLRHVLLHELGHVVGLNHVNDLTQVMDPYALPRGPVHYAAGDLEGLSQVGVHNGCQ